MQIKITKLPKSQVEIEGEIESENFEKYFDSALRKLGEQVEIDGFRKGKVPENILLANIPEIKILEEMAESALNENYPKILAENKIDAIGRPEISIIKLARKNPLGFKIKVSILPEVKLPDYKAIAKKTKKAITEKEKDFSVSEEEIENTIMDIRKSRAPKKDVKDLAEEEVSGKKIEAEELPPFDDEYVKSLGAFESISDFREKLKTNMALEKENQLREKTRLRIMESIIKESSIDLPDLLVEMEIDKIIYRMESDINQMGLKFEDYLKHLNKTEQDLRKDFQKDGEERAKLALVLNKIGELENLVADLDLVEKEVAHILEHYKDADPNGARAYAHNVLTNEKIFKFLESQE